MRRLRSLLPHILFFARFVLLSDLLKTGNLFTESRFGKIKQREEDEKSECLACLATHPIFISLLMQSKKVYVGF